MLARLPQEPSAACRTSETVERSGLIGCWRGADLALDRPLKSPRG